MGPMLQERGCTGPGDPDFDLAAALCGEQQAGSMTLLAVLLCTLVRGAKLQEAKARRSNAASRPASSGR